MATLDACPHHRQQAGWQAAAQPPSQPLGWAPAPAPFGCPYATSLHRKVVGLVEARLRQTGRLHRYTLAEVARHNTKDDAWVAVDGRVSRLSMEAPRQGPLATQGRTGCRHSSCQGLRWHWGSPGWPPPASFPLAGLRHHPPRRHAPWMDQRLCHLPAAGHPAHPRDRLHGRCAGGRLRAMALRCSARFCVVVLLQRGSHGCHETLTAALHPAAPLFVMRRGADRALCQGACAVRALPHRLPAGRGGRAEGCRT